MQLTSCKVTVLVLLVDIHSLGCFCIYMEYSFNQLGGRFNEKIQLNQVGNSLYLWNNRQFQTNLLSRKPKFMGILKMQYQVVYQVPATLASGSMMILHALGMNPNIHIGCSMWFSCPNETVLPELIYYVLEIYDPI